MKPVNYSGQPQPKSCQASKYKKTASVARYSPSLDVVIDGGIQLLLRHQIVAPGLLQFDNFARECHTRELHSYIVEKRKVTLPIAITAI